MIKVLLVNPTGSQKIDGELSLDSGIVKHHSENGIEYKHITSLATLGFKVIERAEKAEVLKLVKSPKKKGGKMKPSEE